MSSTLFDLSGRVAVVTGSSRGIGFTSARRMAEHGAKMVICGRRADACDLEGLGRKWCQFCDELMRYPPGGSAIATTFQLPMCSWMSQKCHSQCYRTLL
ncbi:SDR family NAD(P)-dependent oxidoreductase [Paraburkholderia sp. RAU2J]|uniref:SDR family NAD(P)-dependent oxidoreductase n=1 Tax=Paraburkholderia sp. RAU2J TaxID=1938810 RepID=UPI000EB28CAA|nr:SDR family NAD(P)-dependent oxidoreductase [Paraburkholderia sp. RAU2J]